MYLGTNPNTGRPSRDITSVTTPQIRALQTDTNPDNDIDIVSDIIISTEQLERGISAMASGDWPEDLKAKADAVGVSVATLLRSQGQALGYGDILTLQPIEQAPATPDLNNPTPVTTSTQTNNTSMNSSIGPTDMYSGAKALERLGVPNRGAAYLSANIMQESSWNGMRDWGQVLGDGTSRNGGLVSWASWSDDPARLGVIERHLGKPITQATHTEQLNAMMWEMETYYPQSYRIFMNPNATDAQLRRASYAYWGYGEEGRRFTYANDILRRNA